MTLTRSARALMATAMLWACAARPAAVESTPVAEPQPEPRACAQTDPVGLAECIDAERYEQTLRRVVGRRPPGSQHWRAVQHLCDTTLSELGFAVERHDYGTGVNVVGVLPGERWPAQQVVVGAHYDHIPGCPGADDNASGVAAVLEMARVLSSASFPRTLTIACWDEEERGMVGSRAWATQARARDDDIAVYVNFDAIAFTDPRPGAQQVPTGFGVLFPEQVAALEERGNRADFITIVSDAAARTHAEALARAADDHELPVALLVIHPLVQRTRVAIDLQRSDHASLWNQGYPAIMITDTAEFRSDAYHCYGRPDTVDGLDLPFATRVVRATTQTVAEALRHPGPIDAGVSSQPPSADG